ncbi:hypothetical protein PO878_05795 [Iamia majanohamensis]|uniref:Glycosyltransferase n=1 Tax=Iamia majanohamensis TaxID=467976 RepID=A0AAE9YBT6_9ACTN|nr:hypothetical protein [Iamia majanohamensis]WCO68238.1 hypothetical protein PO878_05795 [Iamia majanohamensis]
MTTIGFYAHHVGRGHLDRVAAICAHLGDVDCTVASTHPSVADLAGPRTTAHPLPGDEGPGPARDRTAGGRLHHVPLGLDVAGPRVRALVAWVERERPDLVVVDVSTEVLLTVRLMGVPVVAVRLHGDRGDPAHRLAFDVACSVVAPFPAALEQPTTPPALVARTFHAGVVHPPTTPGGTPRGRPPRPEVLVAWGEGSPGPSAAALDAAARATPGWDWAFVGPPAPDGRPSAVDHRGWVTDLPAHVRRADVVVGPCGDGLLAAVAAGGGRLVALPQDRPHDEQRHKAEALRRAGAATVLDGWPAPEIWPGVLEAASAAPPLHAVLGADGAPGLAAHLRRLAIAPTRPDGRQPEEGLVPC